MSTVPNTLPAGELKRKGAPAIEERLGDGPVHVLRHNRPVFVAISEEAFAELVADAERSWIAESLGDIREGRVRRGSVADLIAELGH